MTTLSLIAVVSASTHADGPSSLVEGVSEVIEVRPTPDASFRAAAKAAAVPHKYLRSFRRIPGRVNLGVSAASSDWVALYITDGTLRQGWADELKRHLHDSPLDVLFCFPYSGFPMPLIAVRRLAFVHGAMDERFPADAYAALHWANRIYGRTAIYGRNPGGIGRVQCGWWEAHPVQESHPLAALLELGGELHPGLRADLLARALASPAGVEADLREQLQKTEWLVSQAGDPYRGGSGYRPRDFWERNTADYVRWEVYQPDEPEIVSLVGRTAPRSVLELGCGLGRNTRYFETARAYVGLDIARNLLTAAKERQQENSFGVVLGDASALGFADARFDLVFSDSTLQHVTPDNIERAVEDIARVSSRYVGLIEYTRESEPDGSWFKQVHMFAHDYKRLFQPYANLVLFQEVGLQVHPAVKEVFLFEKG